MWIHEAVAEWIRRLADYFDNAMTKFSVNNRTDAWKLDVQLFYTKKTNCQIVYSRLLSHRINSKFMCLSAIDNKN